jgi:signal transduction histidine kinase
MFVANSPRLDSLSMSSTLADLPVHEFTVDANTAGQAVAAVFERQPALPGVLITNGGAIVAAFSRRKFLEQIGRPFGVEIYLTRPIAVMVETTRPELLVLPHDADIHTATQLALQRPSDAFYEPVIVQFDAQTFRLLETSTLLMAQSRLLSLAHEAEQKRRQLAESLQKIGQAISSALSLESVTRRILKELNKVAPFDRGAVLLVKEDCLESVYHHGFPPDIKGENLRIPINQSEDDIFQRILSAGEPAALADVSQDPSWRQLDWLPLHRSWLGAPLITQRGVIGMLSLTRQEANAFTPDDVQLAKTFAGQAATALQNASLYEQVTQFNATLEVTVAQRTAELNKAYRVLEKLDKSKSDFISVTAHELRTPLTIIKGYAQMLQMSEAIKGSEILNDQADKILTGVERMYLVINSMLDMARIDANSLPLRQEKIAPADLLAEVVQPLRAALKGRALTLQLQGMDDLPAFYGDWAMLGKLFHGLLTNAIKYTPDGRTITVSGQMVKDENGRDEIEFVVADEGIGIDSDQQDLIFEKFYQVGDAALHSSGQTKFKGGGPGLGLAIARGVALMHGGRIWAESDGYDEAACPGSRFFVRLPLRPGVEVTHVPTHA